VFPPPQNRRDEGGERERRKEGGISDRKRNDREEYRFFITWTFFLTPTLNKNLFDKSSNCSKD